MAVTSNYPGTAYLNLYKRTSSGNKLLYRTTKSGRNPGLSLWVPYDGGSWFETYGFNSSNGSASGSDNC
jgi:hypothetical protein